MGKHTRKKKKPNYSKLLCAISVVQFFIVIWVYIWALARFYDTNAFAYIFPSSATLASASCAFYYNKAKVENLSKQKIRNVYLTLFLQGRISDDAYRKIETELCDIDSMVDMKLNSMLQESINTDISSNGPMI